jgi:cytochrome c553
MSKKNALKAGEKILFTVVGAFVVLAMVGYIVLETVRARSEKPLFEVKTHFDLSKVGDRGSAVFRKAGCTSCHRALRNGTNMGLSLDGVGSRRSKEWLLTFMKNPEATYESRTLDHGLAPKEAAYVAKLPEQDLQAIAVFLSELRADQGSASAPVPPAGRSAFIDDMVRMWAPKDWNEKYDDVRDREQQSGNDSN